MKAHDIIDVAIELAHARIVVEHNGHRMPTSDYLIDEDERGDPVIVFCVGRKKTPRQKVKV